MAYHVALKTPDTYRAYADECEKLANHAADIADTETKVALQLTAKAWTMLATQVEAREAAALIRFWKLQRSKGRTETLLSLLTAAR